MKTLKRTQLSRNTKCSSVMLFQVKTKSQNPINSISFNEFQNKHNDPRIYCNLHQDMEKIGCIRVVVDPRKSQAKELQANSTLGIKRGSTTCIANLAQLMCP